MHKVKENERNNNIKTHMYTQKIQLWDSNPQPFFVKNLAFFGAKDATYAATSSTSMCTYC